MNNKNRKLRGFTLIEMIICIALFSIIMLCAFKIYEPVSNMFRSANISERSYSYTNNIENIVQSRLDNADNVWIYTGRMDDGDLANICNMIKENYYNGMIIGTGTGETTDAPAIGTMHIMHVLNSDLNTASENYPSGQIVLSDFDFECAETESIRESDVEGAYDASIGLLPDAYFNANGYRFSYCMGTGALRGVTAPAGSSAGDLYQALDIDMDGDTVPMNAQNISMSVVVTGNTDFTDETDYRAFRTPCTISSIGIALPTINGSARGHQPRAIYYREAGEVKCEITHIPLRQSVVFNRGSLDLTAEPVESNTDVPVNFNDDIYFIYTYAEEFHV